MLCSSNPQPESVGRRGAGHISQPSSTAVAKPAMGGRIIRHRLRWRERSSGRPEKNVDKGSPKRQYVVMRHVVAQPDDPEGKPLTEAVLLILASLADRPRHGYGLMKDIETLSNGRVRLSTGTLYGALRRLLEDAWIETFEQDDTSRDKQAYKLTVAGRRQLQVELDRMKQLTRAAGARLRMSES